MDNRIIPHVPVWTYTYKQGPDRGNIIFQSPQSAWHEERKAIVLRQVNGALQNKAWVNYDPNLVERCANEEDYPCCNDAHGVLASDGFGWALQSFFGNKRRKGGPLVSYVKGERIWVEHDMNHGLEIHDFIPVISIDTLESFLIPFDRICWTPQFVRTDRTNVHYLATVIGSVKEIVSGDRISRVQAVVEWPAGMPFRAKLQWISRNPDLDIMDSKHNPFAYRPIIDVNDRVHLFQDQWSVLAAFNFNNSDHDDYSDSESEGSSGFIDLDEPFIPAAQQEQDDDMHLSELTQQHLAFRDSCNMSTACQTGHQSVQLEDGQTVALRTLRHYHVQHHDTTLCSQAAQHTDHCILRVDNWTCVLASAQHMCCVPRQTLKSVPSSSASNEGSPEEQMI